MIDSIGIIGAGRVGVCLGRYLSDCGARLQGYLSRSTASAEFACAQTAGICYQSYQALLEDCQVILIATPDDAIVDVVQKISSCRPKAGKIYCHLSGATPSAVLKTLLTEEGGIFSLHPICTFADKETLPEEMRQMTYTAEGEGDSSFIKEYFQNVKWILPEQKPLYHAAMCIISNYMVTLLSEGLSLLEPFGITPEDCSTLLMKTLENVLKLGPERSLTGPISRGDAGTVSKHLAALGAAGSFYTQMGIFTADFAKKSNQCSLESYKKVMEVLKNGQNYHE